MEAFSFQIKDLITTSDMLDSIFSTVKYFYFTLLLSSCGGSNDSSSTSNEDSFINQPKSISGLVVDGQIRNATVWILKKTQSISN